MNRIKAKIQKSKYIDAPHLVISIDGVPFDEILDNAYPEDNYKGLIPTLLDWMYEEDEKELTWERILPKKGETVVAPILICPDDLDFSCTTIVAEVKNENNKILWSRVGIDQSEIETQNVKIGKKVFWLEKLGPYVFQISDYETMLKAFKEKE